MIRNSVNISQIPPVWTPAPQNHQRFSVKAVSLQLICQDYYSSALLSKLAVTLQLFCQDCYSSAPFFKTVILQLNLSNLLVPKFCGRFLETFNMSNDTQGANYQGKKVKFKHVVYFD
jgi:hypothetical protein